MNLIALLSIPHLELVSHTHCTLIVVAHVIYIYNKSFFINFTTFDGGNVMFGDGNMACVKGKDTNIPNLEEVLLVEGL